MKKKYDVVMYFYWVHPHVVGKYLSLHQRVSKYCDVLTILGKGEFGISEETFQYFKRYNLENVVLKDMNEALALLENTEFKLGVFSSNGRKGWITPRGISTEPLKDKDASKPKKFWFRYILCDP